MVSGGLLTIFGGAVVTVLVAVIARLRRPKSLALEDKRSEVDILATALGGLETALRGMQSRLDECEVRHDKCETDFSALKSDHEKLKQDVAALMNGKIATYPHEEGSNG